MSHNLPKDSEHIPVTATARILSFFVLPGGPNDHIYDTLRTHMPVIEESPPPQPE